ncbi:hypothetical protein SERLA73DRAFT_51065 [Serpula lacrymans var. lacrymans S7.3]|uniref:Timeless N-terminal domain-containing protein n=1 Tax=Serpula lacrymans var. lacrymans (strain S7.3) TaxID=936435 RepID=F8PS75_SERL3|nr:hypothetical protein SERLA73DRAFT_51065 [Serpula lacrymans var. lacrymans S7.3]
MDTEVISLHSEDSDKEGDVDRRAILEPVIRRVVDALGGYEGGVYRLGDELGGCLRDLKKLWRKDDTDDERTVARIFWETRVLPNDLVPILLATAGQGLVEDKGAIACADLMTAMIWPIDMAEELKELDENLDKGTDYTQLLFSHLTYKAALLKPGVMAALFGILLPPLSKPPRERKERDGQIVNVILHLFRNLAFIKDPPPNMHLSVDQAEFSSLQTKLIKSFSESHILDLLLTVASDASNDLLFNGANTLVLEIFYLLFRGVKPSLLAIDQAKQPAQNLHRLLAAEGRIKRDHARNSSSRHSRFGTTIAAPASNGSSQSFVLHRQQAISREAGSIMDMTKRQKARNVNKVDELTREDNLSMEAKATLRNLAREFIESCFNPFLSSLLKDIKSERPKITEKDNLRLLYVTKWFLEFFLVTRTNQHTTSDDSRKWGLGLIAEVTDGGWITWVLKRMREAMDEKPKMWTELQAGIECLTQLLLLIDNMTASTNSDTELDDAADILQQQLIYNGEVLDVALESLRSYKEGTQTLTYLDSSIHLSHALIRMLECWGKQRGEMYVRKKKASRNTRAKGMSLLRLTPTDVVGKGLTEEDGIPDVEDLEDAEDAENVIHETMFTFEAFEMKFANAEITHTLLTYLARYKEYESSEQMKRVVSLIHRQAVKAKAEGLFFNASTFILFKSILDEQRSLPREQAYKDLVNLINFILRQFFKAMAEQPFLAVEAFFPKNRGHWKQYSSWEPDQKSKKGRETIEDTAFPPEVQVKKGYSWSEQIGIAVASLVEEGKIELVEWVKDILTLVVRQRERVVEETDDKEGAADGQDLDDFEETTKLIGPSDEAISKFTDYVIPYINDEHANAATKNSRIKLVFRLLNFSILSEGNCSCRLLQIYAIDADELEWFVPAALLPSDLQRSFNVIEQYLKDPIDLNGKNASQMLSSKRRRRRRQRSLSPDTDVEFLDDEPKRRKKERQKKEKEQYKSAQFIEDSDEEYGDMDTFLEKEKVLREKAAKTAAETGKIATMKATGTKKRRRNGKDIGGGKKKWRGDEEVLNSDVEGADSDPSSENDDILASPHLQSVAAPDTVQELIPKPRPKPRPTRRSLKPLPEGQPDQSDHSNLIDHSETIDLSKHRSHSPDTAESDDLMTATAVRETRRKGRIVISDDDEGS